MKYIYFRMAYFDCCDNKLFCIFPRIYWSIRTLAFNLCPNPFRPSTSSFRSRTSRPLRVCVCVLMSQTYSNSSDTRSNSSVIHVVTANTHHSQRTPKTLTHPHTHTEDYDRPFTQAVRRRWRSNITRPLRDQTADHSGPPSSLSKNGQLDQRPNGISLLFLTARLSQNFPFK